MERYFTIVNGNGDPEPDEIEKIVAEMTLARNELLSGASAEKKITVQILRNRLLAGFSAMETADREEMLRRLRNNVREHLMEDAERVAGGRPMPVDRGPRKGKAGGAL